MPHYAVVYGLLPADDGLCHSSGSNRTANRTAFASSYWTANRAAFVSSYGTANRTAFASSYGTAFHKAIRSTNRKTYRSTKWTALM